MTKIQTPAEVTNDGNVVVARIPDKFPENPVTIPPQTFKTAEVDNTRGINEYLAPNADCIILKNRIVIETRITLTEDNFKNSNGLCIVQATADEPNVSLFIDLPGFDSVGTTITDYKTVSLVVALLDKAVGTARMIKISD